MKALLIRAIGFYRRRISPAFGQRCRFHPTCSSYAIEAIETHGSFKGLALTVWRLLRCQPLCKGGYDPVPLSEQAADESS